MRSSDDAPPPQEPISEDAATLAASNVSDASIRSISGAAVARSAGLPERIGPYRIVGFLGEGGMGIVFEAEQENPRRRVALKVIRGGTFVDEQQVRMFQREVDTLAHLKHPNIGAIYDAGRTERGEHFFAMELVRGRTLDAYLRTRDGALGAGELRDRLRLFLSICDAVHYAHQRGVIHRDLKPSNIVVAEADAPEPGASGAPASQGPSVKILDFGLARITSSDVDIATAVSEVGVIKGTLPYMSPEQARGESDLVDLRTDVYALGVILFEMLTGRRPYDVQRSSIVESIRIICEQPPASLRDAWPGARPPDADLQTIVGKALEKEPGRRYSSASALAEDVARTLDSRPILARAPSTMYQLQKFARRNRTLVAGVVATLVALVAGIVVSTTFGLREAAQRRTAEQARKDTEAVVTFQQNMLGGIDAPRMAQGLEADLEARLASGVRDAGGSPRDTAAAVASLRSHLARINTTDAALRVIDANILATAIETAATQFADRPTIRAQLLSSIGETYFRLGLYDKARPPLLTARALYDSASGPSAPATLQVVGALATLNLAQGRLEEAEALFQQALAGQRRRGKAGEVEANHVMSDLGLFYLDSGRPAMAESVLTLALAERTRLAGEKDRFTLTVMSNLAWVLNQEEKYARAESLMSHALALRREVLGSDNAETMTTVNNLAVIYVRSGKPEMAEPLYREDLETSRRLLGDEHPDVLVSMTNLGRLYNAQKKYADAEAILRRALVTTRKVMPPGFIGLGITALAHSEALIGLGRFAEAEPELLEAYPVLHAEGGDAHPGVQRCVSSLVTVYENTGRPAQAATWKRKLVS